jgi:hypothetical protein
MVAAGVMAAWLGFTYFVTIRHPPGPAMQAERLREAPELLDKARAAALVDDWTEALRRAQQAGEASGLAAHFQAEIARGRAATRGAEWKGSAAALGIGPDDAVLVALAADPAADGGVARNTVRMIDVGAGAERSRASFDKPVASVSIGRSGESGKGFLLVRLEGGALLVLDATTLERKAEFDLPPDALAAASQDKLLIADRGLLVATLAGGPRERLCDDGGDPFTAVDTSGDFGLGLRRSGKLETWHLVDHKLVSVAEGLRQPADLGAKVFLTEDGALAVLREGKRTVLGRPETPAAALATAQGRWVATAPGVGKAGPIELWDVSAKRRALVLPSPPGGVRALTFNEGGRVLAALGPQGVQTWKLPAPPDALKLLRWQQQRLVLFAPSGVLASADPTFFELATSNGVSGFERRGWLKVTPPPPGPFPQAAFSAQGLHVAIAGAADVQVAALGPTGSLSFSARVPATGGVALSENGDRLFVATPESVRAFDVRTEKPLWTGGASCAALLYQPAQAGARLLCAEREGNLLSLDPQTGVLQTKRRVPQGVRALAVSSKGVVALAAASGVVLWTAEQSHLDVPLPGTGPGAQVAFSTDGRLLATASSKGDLLLWDVRRAPVLLARLAPCAGEPASLSFSPLGVALAAACGGSAYLAPVPELPEEK